MSSRNTAIPSRGEGKVIVTGAGGAIGSAIVRRLLDAAYDVIAIDMIEPSIPGATGVGANLTSTEDRAEVFRHLDGAVGLVNAAGINLSLPPDQITDDTWDRTLDINVKVVFHLTQAAGNRLADGGAVVNIASTAANLARVPSSTAYAASKAAVVTMTKSLARGFAPRIRINSINPGLIATPMQTALMAETARSTGSTIDDLARDWSAGVALRRLGSPSEVAGIVRFLIGDEASYITGTSFDIDGGLSMR